LETVTKYGAKFQENKNSSQVSMFGGDSEVDVPEPVPPVAEEWPSLTKLSKEKEVVGIYISGHPLDDFKLEIDSFCKGEVADLNKLEDNNNKELVLAGIITEAEHRTTKNGKPFGTYMLEDYSDSNKQFVFGDSYMKFRHMFNPGTFVLVTGKIGARKWGDGLEFSPSSIELLSNLKEKRTKEIVLAVEQSDITDSLLDELYIAITEHPGDCRVKFILLDHKTETKLSMPSRNLKVEISKELIDKLNKLNVFDMKLG